ncbi:MAG: hypothetical protein NC340_04180 [Ruminococcus flavefaciens]|nr:hypothetical protein [Ruminococcus flavefaciens]MCM1229250.1 hypothetical protein [Ruminococcus flavefaciens]
MKNITKKIIAIFAVLCVAMTSMASCGDKKNESSSTSDSGNEAVMQYPLSIGAANDENDLALDDPNADLMGDDPVAESTSATTKKSADIAPETTVQTVTEAGGQPVTEVVTVTNADGEVQTDSNNQPVTETVVVTEVVTVTDSASESTPAESSDNGAQESTNAQASDEYKSKNDGRYAMWLDCSKDENFYFEDAMLKATFKVKEGIPDGDYKIRISPDLSDVNAVSVKPAKVVDGTIRVNNGEIEAVDLSGETGDYIFYGDNVACKQGETFDFNINIKNNKGLVAFVIWFYFDGNAFEFVDAGATGEFEEVARQTEIGSGNKIAE